MLVRRMDTPEQIAYWRHIDTVLEIVKNERLTDRKEMKQWEPKVPGKEESKWVME